jgi:methylated-DNA-[protein]-cysteine S-methyltransferase
MNSNLGIYGSPVQLLLSHLPSPLGEMYLVTNEEKRIHALVFANQASRLRQRLGEQHTGVKIIDGSAPVEIAQALHDYFAGKLDALDRLPTEAAGSDLQLRVWDLLREVPPGTTTTYGKLARDLGFDDPRAAIDMGTALGANPIALVVPCHRVIAGNGELKGYAWGPTRKRWLLEHESSKPGVIMRLPGI